LIYLQENEIELRDRGERERLLVAKHMRLEAKCIELQSQIDEIAKGEILTIIDVLKEAVVYFSCFGFKSGMVF